MRVKLLAAYFVVISGLFLFNREVIAQERFNVDARIEYNVQENGLTTVTNTITIKNITSEVFAKNYVLNLSSINPQNIKAYEGATLLNVLREQMGNEVTLRIDFDEKVAGKNTSRTFVVTYEAPELATKTGEAWEVTIPRLINSDSFNKYQVVLTIPASFGSEAYISPNPAKIENKGGRVSYLFEKEDVKTSGISAAFGQFQVFTFTLNYHLENPLNQPSSVEIAIPPDTSSQKMYYRQILPAPANVNQDEDGNWLAQFTLRPREKLDVKVEGEVQIFARPIKAITFSPKNLLNNTKPTQFWQSDDSQIRGLASKLKTPRAIYDYVVASLSYDYSRVKPNAARMGALQALRNPKKALCMEFTDLFIAIARAAGIPAREIQGFAYSENSQLQPLSLVADVLHSWPEYWDAEKQVWVSVDPTWEKTSTVDFFNKFDLRHFAFVIHGKDASQPYSPGSYKLGPNPTKDVYVDFSELPKERSSKLKIYDTSPSRFSLFSKNLKVTLENPGPAALYELKPEIMFDGKVKDTNFLEVLPPFAKYEMQLSMPYGLFGIKLPQSIKVSAQKTIYEPTLDKKQIVIYQLLAISALLMGSLLYLYSKIAKKSLKVYLRQKYESWRKKFSFQRLSS